MNFLENMRSVKAKRVESLERNHGREDMRRRALREPPARDLVRALREAPGNAVIAEVKRSSPSAGGLAPGLDPAVQARAYARGGAAAVSVLTEEQYFGGSLADLSLARRAVELPLLAKDFFLDPLELYLARLAGADAALLIADFLPGGELAAMYAAALETGLTPLVEMHSADQLPRVLELKPALVGINHRDLKTLEMDMGLALRLFPSLPPETVVVAESGINGPEDVLRLRAGGLRAFLVGSSLVKAGDPSRAVAGLCRAA